MVSLPRIAALPAHSVGEGGPRSPARVDAAGSFAGYRLLAVAPRVTVV